MTKLLFLNPIILALFVISCTGDLVKEKQVLKSSNPLDFGESKLIKKHGLSVNFKKMETDSFALIFLLSNDSTATDSLPMNINEIILSISLQSQAVDTGFRLISMDYYTRLSIRSKKSEIDSIFHQAVDIIYNRSFDSSLDIIDGIESEDLQRYHSDKFVTSRMACVIIGNFEMKYIESLIERHFYDRTVGTGSITDFNFLLDDISFKSMGLESTEVDSLISR